MNGGSLSRLSKNTTSDIGANGSKQHLLGLFFLTALDAGKILRWITRSKERGWGVGGAGSGQVVRDDMPAGASLPEHRASGIQVEFVGQDE